MAKFASCVLVLVAAFFVADGLRISPSPLRISGKSFLGVQIPSNVTPNDPRCKENGAFVDPNDCTAYYVCVDGTSQDRKCPEEMKFDSMSRCTFENADCGKTNNDDGDVKCPAMYGIFPYDPDCHKYVVCIDGIPHLRTCPSGQWYQKKVGCIEAEKCPQSSSDLFQLFKVTGESENSPKMTKPTLVSQ